MKLFDSDRLSNHLLLTRNEDAVFGSNWVLRSEHGRHPARRRCEAMGANSHSPSECPLCNVRSMY